MFSTFQDCKGSAGEVVNKRQRKKFWKKHDAKFRKAMRSYLSPEMEPVTQEMLQNTMNSAFNQSTISVWLNEFEAPCGTK